jgi:hypothetical protein
MAIDRIEQIDRAGRSGPARRVSASLAAVVLAHFAVSAIHGAAHTGAHVTLGPAGMAFVYVVILAGPLVGLAIAFRQSQVGASIVGLTMAGSLAFGLINHFIIQGADHVAHVEPAWRLLFGSTAALLVVIEAAGTFVGLHDAIRVRRAS